MNVKPSPQGSIPRPADDGLNTADQYGLSTAPFPSGLMETAWRGAWRAPFEDAAPGRQPPAQPERASFQPERASFAHVAFAALMAVASILLVAVAR